MFEAIAQFGPTIEQIQQAQQELARINTYTNMPTTALHMALTKIEIVQRILAAMDTELEHDCNHEQDIDGQNVRENIKQQASA